LTARRCSLLAFLCALRPFLLNQYIHSKDDV
jgi:hypothetical protein